MKFLNSLELMINGWPALYRDVRKLNPTCQSTSFPSARLLVKATPEPSSDGHFILVILALGHSTVLRVLNHVLHQENVDDRSSRTQSVIAVP